MDSGTSNLNIEDMIGSPEKYKVPRNGKGIDDGGTVHDSVFVGY